LKASSNELFLSSKSVVFAWHRRRQLSVVVKDDFPVLGKCKASLS